jgi:hypothetical protein
MTSVTVICFPYTRDSSYRRHNDRRPSSNHRYLALFAPAYPLAPLLAIIRNIYEIRADAKAYCTIMQRPKWEHCEDIGTWYSVLNVLGFVAVMTNASMIAFVGSQMSKNIFLDYLKMPDNHASCDLDLLQACDDACDLRGETREDCFCNCEAEGIWTRIYSPRLWVISMIFEHSVMLARIVVRLLG